MLNPQLKKHNLDGLLVFSPANVSYLCEFPCHDAYLLVTLRQSAYFTDSRYTQEVKPRLKSGFKLVEIKEGLMANLAQECHRLRLKKVGFEEKTATCSQLKTLKKALRGKAKLIPTYNLIEELRQIKTPAEIRKIKKACKIAVAAFKYIPKILKLGRKEIEIVAELERFIRYAGARTSAFDIIVASGPNSSVPHHVSGQRRIRNNEPVLIDLGVDYLGYKSDLTRMFFLGKIQIHLKKLYSMVKEAQKLALKEVKPGSYVPKIDAAARDYLAGLGYGPNFKHSLGHGVGIEVHELPRLSAKSTGIRLKPGMVLTLEPAIYLNNKYGVRVEDMVLVTGKGCEVLSGTLNQ